MNDLSGLYAISGRTGSGRGYQGSLKLTRHGLFYHADVDRGGEHPPCGGLAMVVGSQLVLAFGPHDKMEIGAYTVRGDRATSMWVPPAAKGDSLDICGREELSLKAAGVWTINAARAIDNSTYSGEIHVSTLSAPADDLPGVATMTWQLNDGTFNSFALVYPDALLSCWNLGEEKKHGIAAWEMDGDVWTGAMLASGAHTALAEELRKV
jgi:hypothetical protein